jgi:hypothetical protein
LRTREPFGNLRVLVHHIRETDGDKHTVLMMQVENEVGVLGDSRDRSPAANKAFEEQAPKQLMNYLAEHRNTLRPELKAVWEKAGGKTSGTWQQVFGGGVQTDELFMAWNYGRFLERVAAAGKTEYQLPMYVNTWLGDADSPGKHPSGGALPYAHDMWRAAGNAIDIYSPMQG